MTGPTPAMALLRQLSVITSDLGKLKIPDSNVCIEVTPDAMALLREAWCELRRQDSPTGEPPPEGNPKHINGIRLRTVDELPDQADFRARVDVGPITEQIAGSIGAKLAEWARQTDTDLKESAAGDDSGQIHLTAQRTRKEPEQSQPGPRASYTTYKDEPGPAACVASVEALTVLHERWADELLEVAGVPCTLTALMLPDPVPPGVNNVAMLSTITDLIDLRKALAQALRTVEKAIVVREAGAEGAGSQSQH